MAQVQSAPFDVSEWADRRLAEHGRNLTPSRERLLLALDAADRPLSLLSLLGQAATPGKRPDRVSLHRALKALEECGLIHRLSFGGGYCLCRLPEDPGCHHLLICTACRRTEEVACVGMAPVELAVAASSGFTLESHRIEFVGVCRSCR